MNFAKRCEHTGCLRKMMISISSQIILKKLKVALEFKSVKSS